jgi:hypothetical protein
VRSREVHHIEERLGAFSLEEEFEVRRPSVLTSVSGRLLLWTIAAVVCYAAAYVVR